MKMLHKLISIIMVISALAFGACDDGGGSDGGDGTTGATVINIASIPGVTPPNYDETPVTAITETAQYTGTVSWSPADVAFAATTVYTATITLTAKTGYTLTGVTADFFTVAGATSTTNSADTGIITAVFPATGDEPDIDVVFQSAVETGGTTGTVESTGLTLTFDTDPDTLTADNITVTGARKVSLSGAGTTRTLAIADINVANEGTVSVSITSPAGYSITGSPQTAAVYRITVAHMTIGMDYRGGKLAYILQSGDTGYDENIPHGIIAAGADQSTGIYWGGSGADMTGTGYTTGTALGDGASNTETIVDFFDTIFQSGSPSVTYYSYDWALLTSGTVDFTDGTNTYAMLYYNDGKVAAKPCADYEATVNGVTYDDWYLPSIDELKRLCTNRTAIGGFANEFYWSSSADEDNGACGLNFQYEIQVNGDKSHRGRVRAVRAF